jgi:hypothetical protein
MMRRLLPILVLGTALCAFNTPSAGAAAMMATATLKPPAGMHMMAIEHAMGSARITYTGNGHDATIKLTVDGLPAAKSLHARAYVLWLIGSKQTVRAGTLSVQADGMGGISAMTMFTKFSKLAVTAEMARTGGHPMGTRVLVGTVMHH